jgi:hypothetical protein
VYWAPLKQKVQKQPVLKPHGGKFDSESKRDPMIVDFVVYILLSSSTKFCAAINIHLFIYVLNVYPSAILISCTQDRTPHARLLRTKKLQMKNCGQSVSSPLHDCIVYTICMCMLDPHVEVCKLS